MGVYEKAKQANKKTDNNNCNSYEISELLNPQQTSPKQKNIESIGHQTHNFSEINTHNTTTNNPEIKTLINQIGNSNNSETLDNKTRTQMENELNYNFGSARIHTDTYATNLTNALNAKATCYGQDIYFGKNQYNPNTQEGLKLIGHELSHVREQALGNVHAPACTIFRDTDHETRSDKIGAAFANGTLYSTTPVNMNGITVYNTPIQRAPPDLTSPQTNEFNAVFSQEIQRLFQIIQIMAYAFKLPKLGKSKRQNEYAKLLQEGLNLYSEDYNLNVDGYFGSNTENAVKSFREDNGLDKENGTVDYKMWYTLLNYWASHTSSEDNMDGWQVLQQRLSDMLKISSVTTNSESDIQQNISAVVQTSSTPTHLPDEPAFGLKNNTPPGLRQRLGESQRKITDESSANIYNEYIDALEVGSYYLQSAKTQTICKKKHRIYKESDKEVYIETDNGGKILYDTRIYEYIVNQNATKEKNDELYAKYVDQNGTVVYEVYFVTKTKGSRETREKDERLASNGHTGNKIKKKGEYYEKDDGAKVYKENMSNSSDKGKLTVAGTNTVLTPSTETHCNVFSYDVIESMGITLPERRGANDFGKWLAGVRETIGEKKNNGKIIVEGKTAVEEKWELVPTAKLAQEEANKGIIVIASTNNDLNPNEQQVFRTLKENALDAKKKALEEQLEKVGITDVEKNEIHTQIEEINASKNVLTNGIQIEKQKMTGEQISLTEKKLYGVVLQLLCLLQKREQISLTEKKLYGHLQVVRPIDETRHDKGFKKKYYNINDAASETNFDSIYRTNGKLNNAYYDRFGPFVAQAGNFNQEYGTSLGLLDIVGKNSRINDLLMFYKCGQVKGSDSI